MPNIPPLGEIIDQINADPRHRSKTLIELEPFEGHRVFGRKISMTYYEIICDDFAYTLHRPIKIKRWGRFGRQISLFLWVNPFWWEVHYIGKRADEPATAVTGN
jgi:hypothetical protein